MPLIWEPRIITLKVRDFAAVRSFYKAVLSLRVIQDEPGSTVTFDLGNVLIRLVKDDLKDMTENFGNTFELTFTLKNLSDIVEVLHKLHVDYNVEQIGSGQKVDITDPEGRILSFISKSTTPP
jgi:catechol-2,3-dioxygenase